MQEINAANSIHFDSRSLHIIATKHNSTCRGVVTYNVLCSERTGSEEKQF